MLQDFCGLQEIWSMEDNDKSIISILHALNLDLIHTCKCSYLYLLQSIFT
jgi:hypothetical protein